MDKIRIGVSACLMGEKVRYDGQAKRDMFITETLSQQFDLVPVCPETELGLGVPREPMHLEGDPRQPRLITNTTGVDLSDRMQAWCDARVRSLETENLCGAIFKSRSPSCDPDAGLFAQAFAEYFPGLPVIDEEQLRDPVSREGFVVRVLALVEA